MKNSKIQWCDHTFNPWWGCTKVSPGCEHCYAERITKRWGKGVWGKDQRRERTSDKAWLAPVAWDLEAKENGRRAKVFCASMADVFDEEVTDAWRNELFHLIERTDSLDWLLLTKRITYARRFLRTICEVRFDREPLSNVWLGVSVEDQARADFRVPILLESPVRVRFLSVEPMLGEVWLMGHQDLLALGRAKLDWIICGGESGPGARPMRLEWARSLRKQAKALGAAFFMKQLGGVNDHHGNLEQLPPDLRVREFPKL